MGDNHNKTQVMLLSKAQPHILNLLLTIWNVLFAMERGNVGHVQEEENTEILKQTLYMIVEYAGVEVSVPSVMEEEK